MKKNTVSKTNSLKITGQGSILLNSVVKKIIII